MIKQLNLKYCKLLLFKDSSFQTEECIGKLTHISSGKPFGEIVRVQEYYFLLGSDRTFIGKCPVSDRDKLFALCIASQKELLKVYKKSIRKERLKALAHLLNKPLINQLEKGEKS